MQESIKIFLRGPLELVGYLIYFVVLFLAYRSNKLFRYKVLYIYYLTVSLLMIRSEFFAPDDDNNWIYNLMFLLTISVLSWFYQSVFVNSVKRFIVLICLLINAGIFVYFDVLKGFFFNHYNNYVYAICLMTVVVYTLLYFHQMMTNIKEENILLDFDFWLSCGYLAYSLGSFFMILYYRDADSPQRGNMWSIQNIILFFSALITLRGFLSRNKQ